MSNTINLVYDTLVTNEDYLQFSGIDLNAELSAMIINDTGDNPAPRFIWGIEDWCKEHLQLNYSWNGKFMTEHQINQFKKGVMYQIQYVLRNGNISNDSGYNTSQNIVISRAELEKISIAPNALKAFRLGGMANIRGGGNYYDRHFWR